jgi:hypothetical protein
MFEVVVGGRSVGGVAGTSRACCHARVRVLPPPSFPPKSFSPLPPPPHPPTPRFAHTIATHTHARRELFVDGYDNAGERIYDKVNGQTCHQCRQKTLGKRTCCSRCASLQGVFCGDCIYMRYGENVDEINANAGAWGAGRGRGFFH